MQTRPCHCAHRGAGFLDAENCVEAVELGWSLGLIPELDVITTRDGEMIGFHDGDLTRMVRNLPLALRGRVIREIDWSELRDLDVGAPGKPRRIPTVAEILTRVATDTNRRLYLDIKQVEFPVLAKLVRDCGVADQVIFASNQNEWIAAWRALLPGAQTLRWIWMEAGATGWAQAEATIAMLRAAGFKNLTQLQLHILVGSAEDGLPFHPTETVIRALNRELCDRNIIFQAFPHAGSIEGYRRLLRLGVESFATDHPHELLKALDAVV